MKISRPGNEALIIILGVMTKSSANCESCEVEGRVGVGCFVEAVQMWS